MSIHKTSNSSSNSVVELARILLDRGIETHFENCKDKQYLNLNAKTKSEMKIDIDQPIDSDGNYCIHGRYGEEDTVEDLVDLCHIYLSRYAQKSFGSEEWLEMCYQEGLIEKKTEQVATYKISG